MFVIVTNQQGFASVSTHSAASLSLSCFEVHMVVSPPTQSWLPAAAVVVVVVQQKAVHGNGVPQNWDPSKLSIGPRLMFISLVTRRRLPPPRSKGRLK